MFIKNFCLKMSVMTLLFGFMVIWSLEAQTDSRLNGKWFGVIAEGLEVELSLNNGNYESLSNGVQDTRGTYTASNGEFTMKPTSVFGGSINTLANTSAFENKWYEINEFVVAVKAFFIGLGLSEDVINEVINLIISPPASSYSVDGNTLSLTAVYEGYKETVTYTRR